MSFWNLSNLQIAARLGSISAKLGGITATAFGIYRIWGNQSDYSWQTKVGLSLLYSLHMGSISLTTAVLLGASDVSAPTATAIVCASALLKSIGDHLVEKSAYVGLARKHSGLQEQLGEQNVDFHTNLTLIEDLKETDDTILYLRNQVKTYHNLLKNAGNKSKINDAWLDLKESTQSLQYKSTVIQGYFSEINLASFDVDVAIKALQVKASNLSGPTSRKQREEKEKKLKDNGIILLQCIKYKRVFSILNEINLRLRTLPENSDDATRNHLMTRQADLENRLRTLTLGETPSLTNDMITVMERKTPQAFKKALQDYLKDEISAIEQKITLQQTLLLEKKNYLCRPIDFAPFVDHVKGISAMRNQLSLLKLSERSKSKSVDFGMISAVSALILAIMPNARLSFALNPLMLSIGVVAGIVSLNDLYKRYQASNQITDNEKKQLKQFIMQKKFQIAKLSDAHLRTVLSEQLDKILHNDESHVPVASTDFVANNPRLAKLEAKSMIYQHSRVQRRVNLSRDIGKKATSAVLKRKRPQ